MSQTEVVPSTEPADAPGTEHQNGHSVTAAPLNTSVTPEATTSAPSTTLTPPDNSAPVEATTQSQNTDGVDSVENIILDHEDVQKRKNCLDNIKKLEEEVSNVKESFFIGRLEQLKNEFDNIQNGNINFTLLKIEKLLSRATSRISKEATGT